MTDEQLEALADRALNGVIYVSSDEMIELLTHARQRGLLVSPGNMMICGQRVELYA